MPTYSYACTACEHRFDAVQAFTDPSLTDCPECLGRLRKLFSSVGIVFKGSGFYRTDSRADKANGSGSADKSAPGSGEQSGSGDKSSADKSESKASKAESTANSTSGSSSGSSASGAASSSTGAKSASTTAS